MAVGSVCARIIAGQDNSCIAPVRRYEQEVVVINRSDLDTVTITAPTGVGGVCAYNVAFSLKEGTTGYRIQGSENGSVFKGMVAKTVNDTTGIVQYAHTVQMLLIGIDEDTKCILNGLDKGSYVVAIQAGDIVEIYGIQNGLTTGDYTWDLQEGGGGTLITLTSREISPESTLPLVYKSATPDGEIADFDDAFANAS